ncbi:hypothetical protein [Streptomyces sp. NPDC058108]|uniref:hypothetical protein n=1 Tax=Streptomyces sp. NPDC058108 TaxID=3346344 RepID=UPI0036EFB98C
MTDLARLRRLRDQLAAEHATAVRADQAPARHPDVLVSPHNGIAAGLEIAVGIADRHLQEAGEGRDAARTALAEILACLYPITRAGDPTPIGWQAIHPIRPADHRRWTEALEGAGGVDADEEEAASAYQRMLDTPPSAATCAAIKARLESGDVPRRTVRRRPTATEATEGERS